MKKKRENVRTFNYPQLSFFFVPKIKSNMLNKTPSLQGTYKGLQKKRQGTLPKNVPRFKQILSAHNLFQKKRTTKEKGSLLQTNLFVHPQLAVSHKKGNLYRKKVDCEALLLFF